MSYGQILGGFQVNSWGFQVGSRFVPGVFCGGLMFLWVKVFEAQNINSNLCSYCISTVFTVFIGCKTVRSQTDLGPCDARLWVRITAQSSPNMGQDSIERASVRWYAGPTFGHTL